MCPLCHIVLPSGIITHNKVDNLVAKVVAVVLKKTVVKFYELQNKKGMQQRLVIKRYYLVNALKCVN